MSQFIGQLRLEEIYDGSNNGKGTWRLLEDFTYESDVMGGTVVAPKGLITDLDSIPRAPFVYLILNGYARRAAIPHDALYQAQTTTRAMADAVLREACIVCGVPAWMAWAIWTGVRVGGGSHWKQPGQEQDIAEPIVYPAIDPG